MTFWPRNKTATYSLIFRFYELTLPLLLMTMYKAFVAAGAAYDSGNLSFLSRVSTLLLTRDIDIVILSVCL